MSTTTAAPSSSSSVATSLMRDVFTPSREHELFTLLTAAQDGGRPSPLEQMFINSTSAMSTPEGYEMVSTVFDLGMKYALAGI
jgi:hypothetical protein